MHLHWGKYLVLGHALRVVALLLLATASSAQVWPGGSGSAPTPPTPARDFWSEFERISIDQHVHTGLSKYSEDELLCQHAGRAEGPEPACCDVTPSSCLRRYCSSGSDNPLTECTSSSQCINGSCLFILNGHAAKHPQEVIDGAAANGLDAIVLSEHTNHLGFVRGEAYRNSDLCEQSASFGVNEVFAYDGCGPFTLPDGKKTSDEWKFIREWCRVNAYPHRTDFECILGAEYTHVSEGHRIGYFPNHDVEDFPSNTTSSVWGNTHPNTTDFFSFVSDLGGIVAAAHPGNLAVVDYTITDPVQVCHEFQVTALHETHGDVGYPKMLDATTRFTCGNSSANSGDPCTVGTEVADCGGVGLCTPGLNLDLFACGGSDTHNVSFKAGVQQFPGNIETDQGAISPRATCYARSRRAADVIDAVRNGRCYSSLIGEPLLKFSVEASGVDCEMGNTCTPPAATEATVHVEFLWPRSFIESFNYNIDRAVIIHNGIEVFDTGSTCTGELSCNFDQVVAGDPTGYWYLRVERLNASSRLAITSRVRLN